MEEAQGTRESPSQFSDIGRQESSESRNLPPGSEADDRVEDPNMQSDTLQIERSNAGSSHALSVFQHGKVGEEREIVNSHGNSVHTERNRQESDAFLQEQETAELQNDSPHSEGSKSELMVLPLGEAGVEKGDPATGSYSLNVFRKEVGEEREDADPQSSSREGNESNLKVHITHDMWYRGEHTYTSIFINFFGKPHQGSFACFVFTGVSGVAIVV